MNRVIHKYPIDVVSRQIVLLPLGAQIISAGVQFGQVVLWVIVPESPESEPVERVVQIMMTGDPFSTALDQLRFIATLLMAGGRLVLHVFEEV